MTPEEQVRLKDGINAFFQGAGRGGWNREVNDEVAKVFAAMLCRAAKCSEAMNWVPRPSYNPGATWLLTNLTRSMIDSLRGGQYRRCQERVIGVYRTALVLASVGTITRLPPCE
jgi:hypothetical protein